MTTPISAIVRNRAAKGVKATVRSLSATTASRATTRRVIDRETSPVLPLVEVVPWLGVDQSLMPAAHALMKQWGKIPVFASDTPGFIVNRIARPFYGESIRILEEGIADVRLRRSHRYS